MLSVLTGMVAAPLHVLAHPDHLHALAPRSVLLPPRGGTTGGYWGLAHGVTVMAVGLVVLLWRRLLGADLPLDWIGSVIGVILMMTGLTVAYRSGRLEAHDHPHLHGDGEHQHIHLHAAPDQVHDHEEPEFGILHGVFAPTNLGAALPVLVLTESRSVLYLVAYLVFATLSMGSLGYWLGHAGHRDLDASRFLRIGSNVGYAAFAVGVIWLVARWPF